MPKKLTGNTKLWNLRTGEWEIVEAGTSYRTRIRRINGYPLVLLIIAGERYSIYNLSKVQRKGKSK